jgi:hypothetical protein
VAVTCQLRLPGFDVLAWNLQTVAIRNPITAQIGGIVGAVIASENQEASGDGNAKQNLLEKFSNREIAAMFTIAVFLLVYIALGLAIKHNPELARLAAVDGPTPFEAAMAAGAFTFWTWMTYSGRSPDS